MGVKTLCISNLLKTLKLILKSLNLIFNFFVMF